MPTTDPRDPSIDRWLRSLEPREELVTRVAMRARFPEVRADREITARIDELSASMAMDADRLAMILADARLVAEKIEELLGEPPRGRRR